MPTLRNSLTAALVVLLAFAATAPASVTRIDTRDDANVQFISSFGIPNTATYGQLIKAPEGTPVLTGFTFRLFNQVPQSIVFRPEVYAWDPVAKRAVGSPLYEGSPRWLIGTAVQDIRVDTGTVPLTPDSQYVLMFTTSKDFEAAPGNASARYRSVGNDPAYQGGHFVFINNGTNEKQLTEGTWSEIKQDLQFEATFASAQQSLRVSRSGTGTGTVAASAGIDCGSDCSETLAFGEIVALRASANPGSAFVGFSRGCSSNPCLMAMDDDRVINAVFVDVEPPRTMIGKRSGKKFPLRSSEPGSTFECKLGKGKFEPCASPYVLQNPTSSRQVLRVVATDAAGLRDATPAKRSFRYR